MSRSGARDKARRQLTEVLGLLNESVALLGKSRSLVEQIYTQDAAHYLADLDAFCSRPFPTQVNQHPDNQAVDTFAAAMKTKLAVACAKGRTNWDKPCVKNAQLAELLVENLPKGNAGNFEDISNLAVMLHQLGADLLELTLAYAKPNLGTHLTPPKDGIELITLGAVDKANVARYSHLSERNLDAISKGGVFAEKTPDNVVLNFDGLDRAIDIAFAQAVKP
ncbi:hypothetical protein V2K50_20005 [Pseudomonas alliivorans]|nr:hypothetical protein [Pseudomonas alliivorans]